MNKREEATECFDQGLKMTEKYLGVEHYFTQKFKKRKSMVGMVQEQQNYGMEIEGADTEDYVYFQSPPAFQEPFTSIQPEGRLAIYIIYL